MRRARLGELCTIEKGTTGINRAIPGKYPLVVTSEERKSHNEYQFDADAVIIPLVSSTGHGHKSLKRIHFQTGKFAVGSILCAIIPRDKNQLSAEYLYRYLDLNRERELVSRMKGMANVTLPIKEIEQIEIPIPTLDQQHEFVRSYKNLETQSSQLSSELTHQLSLVKQLRQAFLQEAMQGKLVPQDSNDEPATELLKKIKAEKEQLIKEKKIKKEKELPPIKPEEVPFEIPKNWEWCRLGEVTTVYGGLTLGRKYSGNLKTIPYLRVANVQRGFIDTLKMKHLMLPSDVVSNYLLQKDDILVNEGGDFDKVGRCAIWDARIEPCIHQNHLFKIRCNQTLPKFIEYCINSDSSRSYFLGNYKKSTNLASINRTKLVLLPIALPPLLEQQRIAAKLDQLTNQCNELDRRIKQNQIQNELLLQQVLREALQPSKEYEMNNNVSLEAEPK